MERQEFIEQTAARVLGALGYFVKEGKPVPEEFARECCLMLRRALALDPEIPAATGTEG